MDLNELVKAAMSSEVVGFPVNFGEFNKNEKGEIVSEGQQHASFHSFVFDDVRFFINVYPKGEETEFFVFSKVQNLPFSAECSNSRYELMTFVEKCRANGFPALGVIENSAVGFRLKGKVKGVFMMHDMVYLFLKTFLKYRSVVRDIRHFAEAA